MGEMEKDEEGIRLMRLNQIQETINLMARLRQDFYLKPKIPIQLFNCGDVFNLISFANCFV